MSGYLSAAKMGVGGSWYKLPWPGGLEGG